MDVASWQSRLEEAFTERGIIGPHLLPVLLAEQDYRSYVQGTFHGYIVLTDSFLSFYVETLTMAGTQFRQRQDAHNRWYLPLLLLHCAIFRRFRAAENLLLSGYPLSGYALLRDLKDEGIILAAIAKGLTTYEKASGLTVLAGRTKPMDEETLKEIRNHRKREEDRVFGKMIRTKSGLRKNHLKELDRWEQMFHQEVHGSRLTQAGEIHRWIEGNTALLLHPSPNREKDAMYFNRSNEIAWMILRTFPFLQLEPKGFGPHWGQKWTVLDESFRVMVESLEKMGKKIASAIVHVMESKFDFKPENTHYYENRR